MSHGLPPPNHQQGHCPPTTGNQPASREFVDVRFGCNGLSSGISTPLVNNVGPPPPAHNNMMSSVNNVQQVLPWFGGHSLENNMVYGGPKWSTTNLNPPTSFTGSYAAQPSVHIKINGGFNNNVGNINTNVMTTSHTIENCSSRSNAVATKMMPIGDPCGRPCQTTFTQASNAPNSSHGGYGMNNDHFEPFVVFGANDGQGGLQDPSAPHTQGIVLTMHQYGGDEQFDHRGMMFGNNNNNNITPMVSSLVSVDHLHGNITQQRCDGDVLRMPPMNGDGDVLRPPPSTVLLDNPESSMNVNIGGHGQSMGSTNSPPFRHPTSGMPQYPSWYLYGGD